MATDVAIAAWAHGEPGRRLDRHKGVTRAQRRADRPPTSVGSLTPAAADALEEITGDEALVLGLPVLMGWRPFGPAHYLRGSQLADLSEDVRTLLAREDLLQDHRAALVELLALAGEAARSDLVMVVAPD